jgi:DNA polymerase III subunit chi
MGQVLFYHLTRSPVEETARGLLLRAVSLGWRVMVRGADLPVLERLDAKLWLGPEEEFLPHGLAGGPQDALQPILIGTGAIGNAAQALMLISGADTLPGEVEALERTWILFDGNDETALASARAQWKAVTGARQGAQYWSEDGGRWEKKAESVSQAPP